MSEEDDRDDLMAAFEDFLATTAMSSKPLRKKLEKMIEANDPKVYDAAMEALTSQDEDNPFVLNYGKFAEKILRSRGGAGRALEALLMQSIRDDPSVLERSGLLSPDEITALRDMAGVKPRSQ